MRISRAWLSDYVDFDDISDERLSDLITTRVAEVDGARQVAVALNHAIAAHVLDVRACDNKLSVVRLSIGDSEVQVVCGAPNCRAGMLAAYVPPGGFVVVDEEQKTLQVEARDVHGVHSAGMLVSEAELGLSALHVGVFELVSDEYRIDVKPGMSLSSIVGSADFVLEIDNKSLTHRPDLWSHFGFARELSAILHRPLKFNPDKWADNTNDGRDLIASIKSDVSGSWGVAIESGSQCRRFSGIEISNVSCVASPLWMRRRLFSVGAGVRNILVDVSNYVMHDIGQPNHAYDADRINGGVLLARKAKDGERFLGLDDIERVLTSDDIVIADADRAVALGGVIGGAGASICDNTNHLLLESANFDPVCVRLTTKRHQLRTDASNRFEKSQSPYATPLAICRTLELLRESFPQMKIHGQMLDAFVEQPKPLFIESSFGYISQRLGVAVPLETMKTTLSGLGFVFHGDVQDVFKVQVPYYRATRDISIADDLVEEVGRTFGYENVPECAPLISSTSPRRSKIKEFELNVRDVLRGAGFSEAYNYSFMRGEHALELGYALDNVIEIANPIDVSQRYLRSTLVPGLCDFVEKNAKYQDRCALFEVGRSYEQIVSQTACHEALNFREKYNNCPAFERRLLGLAYMSGQSEELLEHHSLPALKSGGDFYALSNVISRVCSQVSQIPITLRPIAPAEFTQQSILNARGVAASAFGLYRSWMHPCRAASVYLNGVQIGVMAEVRPGVLQDVSSRVVIAEVDLELLLEADVNNRLFTPLAKYPDSFFEMSVVMPSREPYSLLDQLLRNSVSSELLKRIDVVSVYEGAPINDGYKSVSVKVVLGALDRTLSRSEIEMAQGALMQAVDGSQYEIRR